MESPGSCENHSTEGDDNAVPPPTFGTPIITTIECRLARDSQGKRLRNDSNFGGFISISGGDNIMVKAVISLIGPPGSGKGTYGSLLASRFLDAAFISVGDILRENTEVSSILKSGALINDSIVNEAVIHSLEGSSVSEKSMIILDGYPRRGPQSHLLAQWPVNLRPSFAVQFDVPYEVCTLKLLGRRTCSICKKSINVNGVDTLGFEMPPMLPDADLCDVRCNPDLHWKVRDDDTVDTIKLRMEIYDKETRPLLEYFEKRKQLLRFVPYNGIKDMDKLVSYVETRLHTLI